MERLASFRVYKAKSRHNVPRLYKEVPTKSKVSFPRVTFPLDSPKNYIIYSKNECEYIAKLLMSQLDEHKKKTKSVLEDTDDKIQAAQALHSSCGDNLETYFTKAKTTVKVLLRNLIQDDIKTIAKYSQATPDDIIKLLLRGEQLYEAREEAAHICRLVIEIERLCERRGFIDRLLQDDSPTELLPEHLQALTGLLQKISKALNSVTVFLSEHHNFKKEF